MPIWHPHLWCETAYLERDRAVRGRLQINASVYLDADNRADTALWALEDVLAGGIWRSDEGSRKVVSITCSQCRLCGATRVTYDPTWRLSDEELTAEEIAAWLDTITRRYNGYRYNGVIWRYGMTLDAMEKRLKPSPSQMHNHVVYTGAL